MVWASPVKRNKGKDIESNVRVKLEKLNHYGFKIHRFILKLKFLKLTVSILQMSKSNVFNIYRS